MLLLSIQNTFDLHQQPEDEFLSPESMPFLDMKLLASSGAITKARKPPKPVTLTWRIRFARWVRRVLGVV